MKAPNITATGDIWISFSGPLPILFPISSATFFKSRICPKVLKF